MQGQTAKEYQLMQKLMMKFNAQKDWYNSSFVYKENDDLVYRKENYPLFLIPVSVWW